MAPLPAVTTTVPPAPAAGRQHRPARPRGGRRGAAAHLPLLAPVVALALVLGACTSSGSGGSDATGGAGDGAADLQAQVEAIVDADVADAGVPGWVVLAWTPDEEVAVVGGDAELDPDRAVVRGEVWPIRSITKSFTVTVVLQLVDEGVLSLADPIGDFLDDAPNPDATLAELASMRSGIRDYADTDGFVDELVADPERTWTDDELLALGFSLDPSFAPGEGYEYSNTNTVALGVIAEQVTGQALADLYAERIYEPLGLDATAYPEDGPIPDPHAVGYDVDPDTGEVEPALPVSLTALGPAGGMVSTGDDLRTWVDALVTGELVDDATQEERVAAAGPTDGGPEYDAYGLGIGEVDGFWGHTGEGLGFSAAALRAPDHDAGVVVLLNGPPERDLPAALARQIIPLLG